VDKATAFHRSSLREKALPKNASRPKNSVNLCESVKSVVKNQSIKNNKLCKTNPIFRKPKMVVTAVYTMTNNNEQRTMNCSKQTQTKPIEETERFRRGATASQRVSHFSIFSQHFKQILHIFGQGGFKFHYFVGGWVFKFEGAGM